MSLNKLQPTVNSQTVLESIDESFFDSHAGFLMSEEMNQGGKAAINAFMTMCNHLENVFNLKLNIIDISQQTVADLMMYLNGIPDMSIAEINSQLTELREFIGWTRDNGIPTQDLSFPQVLTPEEMLSYMDSSE